MVHYTDKMSVIILFIIFATAYTEKTNSQFSCRNAAGKPVDWFVGYKLPSLQDTRYPGTTFYYADERSTNWGPPENLNSSQSAVNQTLSQYYNSKGDQKTFYLLYNDDKPNEHDSSTRGHAKGVAVFGKKSGFWLIHSVPQFPPLKRYFYVPNGKNNGQSFLCITMSTESIEVFAEAMKYVFPNVYDSQIPNRFVTRFPFLDYLQSITKSGSKNVKKKSQKKRYQSKAGHHSKNVQEESLVQYFQSKAGYRFINFEKSGKYGSDLYSGLIAPELKTSMYAETWVKGSGENFLSLCKSEYPVINIEVVNITGKNFTNTRDHSKWAIGTNTSKPFVCIADINRQVSQTKRGGGAVCFKNENIWKMFQQSIVKLQKCGLTTKKATKKTEKETKNETKTKTTKTTTKSKKKNKKAHKH